MPAETYRIEDVFDPVIVHLPGDEQYPIKLRIGEETGTGKSRTANLTRREAAVLAGILEAASRVSDDEDG